MKVLFLTTSYPRYEEDDTSVFLKYLVASLLSAGINVEVIVPDDLSVVSSRRETEPFEVRRFRYGIFQSGKLAFGAGLLSNLRVNPLRILQFPMLCLKMLQTGYVASKNVDAIHAQWIIAAGVGAAIAHLRGLPLVITVHGSEMLLLRSRFLGFFVGRILSKADSIITVSEGFRKTLTERFPKLSSKIVCIPFGSDHFLNCEDSNIPTGLENIIGDNKYLLAVGTLCPRKNQVNLLPILTHEGLLDSSLILCGKTNDHAYVESIGNRAKLLGLTDRVFIIGAQSPLVVAALLKRCSLFVSASTFEGRPVALLEALAAECLTLVSRIPAHMELIEDGINGFLFNLGDDPKSIETSMVLFGDDSSKIKQNARNSVKNLNWDLCASEYKKIYTSYSKLEESPLP